MSNLIPLLQATLTGAETQNLPESLVRDLLLDLLLEDDRPLNTVKAAQWLDKAPVTLKRWRYKGRGPIQLTGRANYRAAGKALGLNLEGNPELAARPDIGFRVSAWYWNSRRIGPAARRGDFKTATRRINGALNGYADRQRYYRRTLRALG